jgi:hypothetical protein
MKRFFLISIAVIILAISGCSNPFFPEKLESANVKSGNDSSKSCSHEWANNWTLKTEAACEVEGSEENKCTKCGAHAEGSPRVINALEHDWDYAADAIRPTCEEDGEGSRECQREDCGLIEEDQVFLALGHEWSDNWILKTPATCIAAKVEKRTCIRECGEKGAEQTRAVGVPGPHNYDWETTIHADYCTDEHGTGVEDGTCQTCDDTDTQIIPCLGTQGLDFNSVVGGFEVGRNLTSPAFVCVPAHHLGEPVVGIANNAFYNNKLITSITIPEGVTSIGSSAFNSCSSLVSIEIPAGVTSIGSSAFSGCSNLVSIEIPAGVTSIGNSAFYSSTNLINIEIPASVTSIGSGAFINCGSLVNIIVAENNTSYSSNSGILYNKDKTILIAYPSAKGDVTIPAGVTSIHDSAFSYCTSLTSVIIPLGVTSIGAAAFQQCSSLISIKIPAGVTSIGSGAFTSCSSLVSIEIPASVTSIGGSAFANCSSLVSIEIPASVTSIGGSAFFNCSRLTSIEIPANVTSIGGSAFANCSRLTSITIFATTPPTLGTSVFTTTPPYQRIIVPAGSAVTYRGTSGWDVDGVRNRIHIAGCSENNAANTASCDCN